MAATQGFADDCTLHFGAMRVGDSWESTRFGNGAEAMAGILEIMRIHEVRALHTHQSPIPFPP